VGTDLSFGVLRGFVMRGEIAPRSALWHSGDHAGAAPAVLLDFSRISIILSILVLMTALMIKKPLEFTAFPSVLLLATLFRLRLISPRRLSSPTAKAASSGRRSHRRIRAVRDGRRVRHRRDRVRDPGDRELRRYYPRLDTYR
jgi:hypothetical protein